MSRTCRETEKRNKDDAWPFCDDIIESKVLLAFIDAVGGAFRSFKVERVQEGRREDEYALMTGIDAN